MIALVVLYYFAFRYHEFERASFVVLTAFFIYYVVFVLVPVTGPTFYYKAAGLTNIANGVFPNVHDYFNYYQDCLPSPGYKDGIFYHFVEDAKAAGERPTQPSRAAMWHKHRADAAYMAQRQPPPALRAAALLRPAVPRHGLHTGPLCHRRTGRTGERRAALHGAHGCFKKDGDKTIRQSGQACRRKKRYVCPIFLTAGKLL